MTVRTIGFIDYFLDNWHSNNYPAWIAAQDRSWRVGMAWAQTDKQGGLTSAAWCGKNGIALASSQEELIETCDALVVLSPDYPEQHEELCALALQSGKPVYVDKTFAPDAATAQRIFSLGDEHNTPLYSTSALRYMPEFTALSTAGIAPQDVLFTQTRGPGVPQNYSIHQLEMLMVAMGTGALRARASGNSACPVVEYEFEGERYASTTFMPGASFEMTLLAQGRSMNLQSRADFWQPFISAMLDFFDTATPAVPREQTLCAIAMYEAIKSALRCPDCWVNVPRF